MKRISCQYNIDTVCENRVRQWRHGFHRLHRGREPDPHATCIQTNCDFNSELGDVAFAFVDYDLKPEKDTAIASAEAIFADTEGQLIVSNPCFEIWFLAHFRFTTKGFRSSQDVTSELSKELGGYSKEDPLIYEKLKNKTTNAIQNAQRMEDHCRKSSYTYHKHDFAPSTDVYKAVKVISGE